MKKDIIVRLAILAIMLIVIGVMIFTEIGIATAFDMKFDGLTYMEYVHEFYSVPWHFMLGLLIGIITLVVTGETIYRMIMEK